jgi:hypothetical protein
MAPPGTPRRRKSLDQMLGELRFALHHPVERWVTSNLLKHLAHTLRRQNALAKAATRVASNAVEETTAAAATSDARTAAVAKPVVRQTATPQPLAASMLLHYPEAGTEAWSAASVAEVCKEAAVGPKETAAAKRAAADMASEQTVRLRDLFRLRNGFSLLKTLLVPDPAAAPPSIRELTRVSAEVQLQAIDLIACSCIDSPANREAALALGLTAAIAKFLHGTLELIVHARSRGGVDEVRISATLREQCVLASYGLACTCKDMETNEDQEADAAGTPCLTAVLGAALRGHQREHRGVLLDAAAVDRLRRLYLPADVLGQVPGGFPQLDPLVDGVGDGKECVADNQGENDTVA